MVSASEQDRPIGFLGLMRNRNYALLWWGQLVSEMGNRFHWIAISLWVYNLSGSASAVSIAVSSMFAGSLIVGLWAGVLVDRLNRKGILIISDFVRAVLVALIPSLIRINLVFVYVDLVLISIAAAFFRPAIFGIMPAAVSRRDLMPANSFFSAMDSGTEIFGPALAGVLAYAYGYALLLYIDAGTFVVSGLCALAMSIRLPHIDLATGKGQTLMGGLIEGLRYIRRDRFQWGLFMLIFPAYMVGSGLNSLQTPLAKGVVGITDAEFGTFNSIWGVGFTVASLILGWFGARVRKSMIILGGFFLISFATALMSQSRSFEFLITTAFVVGFSNTLYYVGLSTVLMEYTPAELIGRVAASRQAAIACVRVAAPIVLGVVADRFGVRASMLALAALGAAGTAVVVLSNPSITQADIGVRRVGGHMFGSGWTVFGGPVSPDFNPAQQRLLSMISLSLALAGWFGVYRRAPLDAIGALMAILVLALIGAAVHRTRWLQGGSK